MRISGCSSARAPRCRPCTASHRPRQRPLPEHPPPAEPQDISMTSTPPTPSTDENRLRAAIGQHCQRLSGSGLSPGTPRNISPRRTQPPTPAPPLPPRARPLAVQRLAIPAFHYMVAAAGGHDIRCARYAPYGAEELSQHALAALKGRRACLLANHGMIAFGADLRRAFALAIEVETLAHQYLLARATGTPVILEAQEMDRVLEKFKSYGVNAQTAPSAAA